MNHICKKLVSNWILLFIGILFFIFVYIGWLSFGRTDIDAAKNGTMSIFYVSVYSALVTTLLTYFLLKETRENRKESLLPILSVNFGKGVFTVQNTGRGLAQHVRFIPEFIGETPFSLTPNESKDFIILGIAELELEYEDVFGRCCSTKIYFRESKYKFIPPNN